MHKHKMRSKKYDAEKIGKLESQDWSLRRIAKEKYGVSVTSLIDFLERWYDKTVKKTVKYTLKK